MDRWKRKELKQMELGGNKNAQLFYEENGMYKDGKPDHEAPLHSRQKAELSAKAEAAIRQEIEEAIAEHERSSATNQHSAVLSTSSSETQNLAPIQGLQSNLFEGLAAPSSQSDFNSTNMNEPAASQATF